MLESEAWQVYFNNSYPIDDVEKLPCMTNDQSNSMPLDQRLFHKPHILVRSTLHFQPREGCPAIGTVDRYPIHLQGYWNY